MRSLIRFSSISLIALSSFAFLQSNQRILADLANLKTPSVAFDGSYSKPDRDQILKILNSEKCTFVAGTTLNSFTTLQYRGDTASLNSLLDDLAKCPRLRIHVSFARPKAGDVLSDTDWCIHHEAHGNLFHFRINLESKQINLEKLYIPDIRSQKEPAESEQSKVAR